MAIHATDFDLSNCTQTAALYNALRTKGIDALPYPRPVLSPSGANLSDQIFRSDLHNSTFAIALISASVTQCRGVICQSLNFNGNADIAGVGVSAFYGSMSSSSNLLTFLGNLRIWFDSSAIHLVFPSLLHS